MNQKKRNVRRKQYSRTRSRRQQQPEPVISGFTLKVFIAFILLLSTLYMKKYDVNIGDFTYRSIYDVLYYDEDFNALSNKVFKSNGANAISDLFGLNTQQE